VKTYSSFTDEISQAEIYEGLLGYGMFSEKLPPVFSSVSFYDYCLANTPAFQDKPRPHVFYESMRNTNVPRQLGIPDPRAYQLLCKCIADNWVDIQTYIQQKTNGQKHIISRIHLRKMNGTKALFKMNYSNWKYDGTPEPDLLIGSKYIVHADISTCFPSIYTHSIPWALVGKDYAKTHRGKAEWFNQIDHYTQNCKYGETHGVLIGPHVSNLLGEIILTNIDNGLSTDWSYIRNIDDYTCFVKTREDAQLFLVALSAELRKYDLTLNHKKTEIAELPMAMTEQWIRQVGNPLAFCRDGIMDYIGVRAYLDSAIEVMQKNKENSAILNYAIKALPVDKLSPNAIGYCIKTIFHLSLLYPYLLQIIDQAVFERFHVPKDQIKAFSEMVYEQELKNKNYDAVCHALFFALKYGILIDSVRAQHAIDSESCVFRLLAFLYFKKNRITAERKLLRNLAQTLKIDEYDFEQNWLFIYEVLPQSDLPGEWKDLKANNVSFLKKEFQI